MDSGTQDDETGRSGGKITKRRRITTRKTPYDRPTQPTQPQNPSWYTGLVFPAKFVATKLVSSIWNPKSLTARSNSSDTDSDSEGGIENDYEGDEKLSDGIAELDKNEGSSGKNEVLYLVEQLLMLERYSREECDKLIEIINSRVVDYTMTGVDDIPENPDICNQTIMKARKLITENMVESSTKLDVDNNVHGSKSVMTTNRDSLSSGAWNIQNTEPNEPISLETPKPEDKRMSASGSPIEVLSSLPTIQEENQITEKKDVEKGDQMGVNVNVNVNGVEGNSDLATKYGEVPDVIASQGSYNTNEPSSTKNPDIQIKKRVTRSRKYTERGRGRARGK